MGHYDWLDPDEYPNDKDIDDFGDDSPIDYDPLTIGYVGDSRPSFWTTRRIVALVIVLIMVGALLLPLLWQILS